MRLLVLFCLLLAACAAFVVDDGSSSNSSNSLVVNRDGSSNSEKEKERDERTLYYRRKIVRSFLPSNREYRTIINDMGVENRWYVQIPPPNWLGMTEGLGCFVLMSKFDLILAIASGRQFYNYDTNTTSNVNIWNGGYSGHMYNKARIFNFNEPAKVINGKPARQCNFAVFPAHERVHVMNKICTMMAENERLSKRMKYQQQQQQQQQQNSSQPWFVLTPEQIKIVTRQWPHLSQSVFNPDCDIVQASAGIKIDEWFELHNDCIQPFIQNRLMHYYLNNDTILLDPKFSDHIINNFVREADEAIALHSDQIQLAENEDNRDESENFFPYPPHCFVGIHLRYGDVQGDSDFAETGELGGRSIPSDQVRNIINRFKSLEINATYFLFMEQSFKVRDKFRKYLGDVDFILVDSRNDMYDFLVYSLTDIQIQGPSAWSALSTHLLPHKLVFYGTKPTHYQSNKQNQDFRNINEVLQGNMDTNFLSRTTIFNHCNAAVNNRIKHLLNRRDKRL